MSESTEQAGGDEHLRLARALLQLIRLSGGEKTFAFRDFSSEAFRYLAEMERDEIIEAVPCDDPAARCYRLKPKV